jgi:hypothetical protein
MKRSLPALLLLLLPLVASPAPCACTFYLSHGGSDAASGDSLEFAFATRGRAHAAAVAASASGCCKSVNVRVGGGVWAGPWVFERGPPRVAAITYSGARSGAPTAISGGTTVASFSAGAGGIWRASVPAGTSGSQLFVGGARRPRARAPNVVGDASDAAAAFSAASTFAWASPLCAPPACAAGAAANGDGLVFAAGDGVDAGWDFSVAQVTAFTSPWATCVERVRAVFAANRTILFAARCGVPLGAFPAAETGERWLVENVRGALDAPGEWFLNVSSAELEYMPLPGEANPAGFSAVLAQRGSLLVVHEDGLAFEDVRVEFAEVDGGGGGGASPAGTGGRGGFAQTGAIEINASDVSLARVTVAHAGANCIVLRPNVSRVIIANSTLLDCGGHGVFMDTADAAADVLVTDARIAGVGFTYLAQPTGVLLNGGANVSAVHCDVRNSSYTGISVAWMHGARMPLAPAAPRFNVSFNRIADFGRGILSDFAGVRVAINNADACFVDDACYVPTLVSHNVITGGRHFNYGANGLYTDNAVAGVDAVANIVADVDGMGWQPHCGVNNTLTNTLVFDARAQRGGNCSANAYTAVVAGCDGWRFANGSVTHAPFAAALARSILVTTQCGLYSPFSVWPNPGPGFPGYFAATNFTAEDNVYFALPGSAPLDFPQGLSFAAWRAASGNDAASVISDPRIRDPRNGDFTVLPDSPAWARGWQAIDTSSVGPRP